MIQMKGSIGMAAPALKLIDQLQDVKLPQLTVNKFTINYEELKNDIVLKNINFNYNDLTMFLMLPPMTKYLML